MEIGSEYWIEANQNVRGKTNVPEWLSKFGEKVNLLSTGRGAINLVLKSIEPKVKVALLPIYICESVIIPFKVEGYEIEFYEIDEKLQPIGLEKVKWVNIGVFFHLGYYGVNTNNSLDVFFDTLKNNNVIIIEDVTHTLFSKYKNYKKNDFVIGSIRKWFGVPSGGFIASEINIEIKKIDSDNEFSVIRKKNLLLKKQYIESQKKELKEFFLKGLNQAEDLIDQNISAKKIDSLSREIIKELDENTLIEKRKKNFSYLVKNLMGFTDFRVVNDYLEEGMVPFFFPIYSKEKRNQIRDTLRSEDIYCPVHWPIPSQVKANISTESLLLYNSILSIPCDQRYDEVDMERIVNVIKRNFN